MRRRAASSLGPPDERRSDRVQRRRGHRVGARDGEQQVAVGTAQRLEQLGRPRTFTTLPFQPARPSTEPRSARRRPLPWPRPSSSSSSFRLNPAPPGTTMPRSRPPAATGLREERRRVAAEERGEIADLEPIAQVGLVDAVPLHGLALRDAAGTAGPPRRRASAQRSTRICSHDVLDVLGADERRLEVDLGELGLAVGAQVFVAEAARDLEVAVEARDHQQLLVELRRLRQRVELARMDAARHEIVAGAFRRGLGEDRRLDLEEARAPSAMRRVALHQPVPQHQVPLQLGTPQVENAVLQPKLLRRQLLLLLPRHWNGRRLARGRRPRGR